MRTYAVEFENVAVTAAQDFFELGPGAQRPIRLLELGLSQSSDVGDAAEELLRVKVIRGHTTSGSGGTTQTPTPIDSNDAASAETSAEVNNTTIASVGTPVDLWSAAFNIRVGLEKIWVPEVAPRVQSANFLVVRLMAAPADELTMSGYVYFAEV